MATTKKAHKKPLVVTLTNAKGELIQGIIPGGELPAQDPFREIAGELSKHSQLVPSAVPYNGR
jgi:hypothetical protein